MALVVADRIKETTTTTGTGTYTLAGAVVGFEAFSSIGDGNTTYYCCTDGTDFEVGIGTYTSSGTTLARTTILQSSNSDSAVNWTAGERTIFVTQPAEKAVYLDASGYIAAFDGRNLTNVDAETLDNINSTSFLRNDNGDIAVGSNKITGLATPTANTDAATKAYVDSLVSTAIHIHDPVRVERPDSYGNLSGTYNNGSSGVGATLTNNSTQVALSIDGVTLSTNDRVLLYNQTDATENGVYTVTNTGSASTNWVLTRATDADSSGIGTSDALDEGSYFYVEEGNTGAGESYVCNVSGLITFGTTEITFAKFGESVSYTGGTGIDINVRDIVLDLSELTTSTSNGDGDFFAVVDSANAQKKLTKANINLSGFNNDSGFLTEVSNLTLSNFAGSTIQLSSESFSDVDTALMTAAAIDDRILSFGYTTNVGDITGVTAGTGLTGGGSSGTVSLSLDGTGTIGAGTYGSTSDLTKIDTITVDAFGRVTAVATGNTGDGGNAATLDSLDSTQFLRSDAADNYTSGTLQFNQGTQAKFMSNGSNPVIDIDGGGPNFIRFTDNGSTTDAVDIVYRTTPNDLRIERSSGNIIAEFGGDDGHAALYFNNSQKLETTSSGATVTGTLQADKLQSDDVQINGTSNDFPSETGNAHIIATNNGGSFPFNESGSILYRPRQNDTDGRGNHYFYTGATPTLRQNIKANGDIAFYASDGTSQNLFWDASTSRLGINNTSPSTALDVNGDLTLTSTDAGATENPILDLYRNSASPANFDVLGVLEFTGENSAGEKVQYAQIEGRTRDVTDGTEDGEIQIRVMSNGAENSTRLQFNGDANTIFYSKDVQLNNVNLVFQGSTIDANETTLTVTDPTADRTITLPDASGTVLLNAGNQTLTGDLTFPDNEKAIFGTGSDLQIYHNGTHSYIQDAGTGDLVVLTNHIAIRNAAQNADIIRGIEGGAVTLSHNGSAKIATTSTGAEITGDLTLTSTDAGATENPTLDLYRNSASPANGDDIGHITFSGENSAGEKIVYGEINGDMQSVTDGSEHGRLLISVIDSGSASNRIFIQGNGPTKFLNRPVEIASSSSLRFQGSTDDSNETTLTVVDPTADRTITLPDASGTVLLNTGNQSITGDLTLTSTDGGATVDPSLILHRDSASPADFDVIGNIQFDAENSAGEQTTYAQIYSQIVDQTDGTEDGYLQFWTKVGGTDLVQFRIGFSTSDFYGNVRINPSNIVSDPALIFEGSTANDFETFLKATDPTADRTITLPDATGTVLLNTGDQSITGDLTLTSTDAGATEDPTLKIYRNSATPTGGDNIGHIQFTGNNASGTEVVLAEIETVLGGTTAGSEEGRMKLKVNDGGTEFTVIEIGYDRVQFNEAIMINNGRQLGFEGSNVDAYETSLYASEPTQDNTITLPDASGTVALQEQAYQAINAQTGTTYTTVLADGGKLVTLSNASAITLTIPPNSSVAYPVGTKLDFIQIGAGQVTVAGGTGVTVNSTPTLKFRAQHSGASCIKIATDTWQLVGDLAES